eukprot:2613138-Amphidinium_carterae.1
MQPRTSQSPPRLEVGGEWKRCPPACRAEGPSFQSLDQAPRARYRRPQQGSTPTHSGCAPQ